MAPKAPVVAKAASKAAAVVRSSDIELLTCDGRAGKCRSSVLPFSLAARAAGQEAQARRGLVSVLREYVIWWCRLRAGASFQRRQLPLHAGIARIPTAVVLFCRATERATAALEQRKKSKATRSAIFKKAESYVKEYRSEVRRWAQQAPIQSERQRK